MPRMRPDDNFRMDHTREALENTPLTAPSFRPDRYIEPQATQPVDVPPVGATPPSGPVPTYQNPNENLGMWGYTGEIPINAMEQQAINFINELYATQGPLATMTPAQDYYGRVLAGEYGPESEAFVQALMDPMRSQMEEDYARAQKGLAGQFSDVGAYFGGRHGVAQGELAGEHLRNMADVEAQLRYSNFLNNMGLMSGAAGGLVGLAGQQGVESQNMLNALLSGGGMITGRDMLNRAEYQNALGRSYQDWLRARNEMLMPFQMSQNLLGQQATMPIAYQTQSPWGALLGGVGQIGGAIAGGYLGKSLFG